MALAKKNPGTHGWLIFYFFSADEPSLNSGDCQDSGDFVEDPPWLRLIKSLIAVETPARLQFAHICVPSHLTRTSPPDCDGDVLSWFSLPYTSERAAPTERQHAA